MRPPCLSLDILKFRIMDNVLYDMTFFIGILIEMEHFTWTARVYGPSQVALLFSLIPTLQRCFCLVELVGHRSFKAFCLAVPETWEASRFWSQAAEVGHPRPYTLIALRWWWWWWW